MSNLGLPKELVARINPVDACAYATAAGWKQQQILAGRVAIYSHPSSDLDQLLIPLNSGTSDYPRFMAEMVANLAEIESRPALEVLNDLLVPPSDILRFRLDEPESQSGLIPLDRGIGLLVGARKALLTAARSIVQPQSFHPRLSRAEAEQWVRASLLGLNEPGDYTAVIACRLDAGAGPRGAKTLPLFETLSEPAPEPVSPSEVPFTRQVTSLLMRSVARIASALDSDDYAGLLHADGSDPPLSTNLCDALFMMRPIGERSRLSLSTTWSRLLSPPAGSAPPSVVLLRGEYFPAIERLANDLRPAREPRLSHFVGLVDSLFGDPDEQGRVRGEVQLHILSQEELIRARVILDADEYHTAWEAHRVGGYVSLNGELVRGGRVQRIVDVSNFKSLKD